MALVGGDRAIYALKVFFESLVKWSGGASYVVFMALCAGELVDTVGGMT